MARNPIERALGVWSGTNYRSVMLPGLGVVTCGELCDAITALKAENERLAIELDAANIVKREAIAGWKDAERALAERAGGVKVKALEFATAFLANYAGHEDGDGNEAPELQMARDLLATLTTEPVAPEGRQEPRAYIVHAPEDDYYGTGPDRLQFHPLAQHDMDNGYRQTPLYGRPAEQAVTEAMVGAGAKAIVACRFEDESEPVTDYDLELSRAALKAAMEAGRDV